MRSDNMVWYEGLPLLDVLDKMEDPKILVDKQPLRLPLICIYKIGGVGTICRLVKVTSMESDVDGNAP